MRRCVSVAGVAATAWFSLVSGACLPGEDKPVEPDRVVNIVWECEVSARYLNNASLYAIYARRIQTDGCGSVDRTRLGTSTLEVTLRTPQGGSYIVTLDPYSERGQSVKVGDPWIP